VEYSLPEKGRAALPMLLGVCQWAVQYVETEEDHVFPQGDHCEHNCNINKTLAHSDWRAG